MLACTASPVLSSAARACSRAAASCASTRPNSGASSASNSWAAAGAEGSAVAEQVQCRCGQHQGLAKRGSMAPEVRRCGHPALPGGPLAAPGTRLLRICHRAHVR